MERDQKLGSRQERVHDLRPTRKHAGRAEPVGAVEKYQRWGIQRGDARLMRVEQMSRGVQHHCRDALL